VGCCGAFDIYEGDEMGVINPVMRNDAEDHSQQWRGLTLGDTKYLGRD
jgi:hypothetical protein